MEISNLGERKLIEKIWKIIGEENEDEDVHFLDLGQKYMLFAIDTINEGYHFERWWNPLKIGKFLVDINLSDIACKNGRPLEMLVSFSFPRDLEEGWVALLTRGIKKELSKYGVKFSGGDLKEARDISLTGLVIGEVRKGEEYRRRGARPGDFVYVSSKIGMNERAIIEYRKGNLKKSSQILNIRPRLDLLSLLKKSGVTSCIDNSDGIYKSLSLISSLSGVGIRIEDDVSDSHGREEERKEIFSMGGDYELVFTSSKKLKGFPLLGRVFKGKGVIDIDGKPIEQGGYDHFVFQ